MSSSPVARERARRPTKKQRIARGRRPVEASPSPSASSSTTETGAASGASDDLDKENDKPASKHRIHIPLDDVIPEDVFLTQPLQRSTSPYRIENFHWQKPQKSGQSPVSKLPHRNGDGQNARTQSGLEQPVIEPSALSAPVDDSNFDLSDEELLADISTHQALPAQPPQDKPVEVVSSGPQAQSTQKRNVRLSRPLSTQANLKQTTLFGTQANNVSSSQVQSHRKWPMANRNEPLTHHEIDRQAMESWVYPINLGSIRDYQYTITATGLFHNTLVALPTGLGKTFIAATIMLNWFRWTKSAQIVFVAPTKPLVAQQVKACFEIAGIPRSQTSMLTGSSAPGLRAEEWLKKRVFFMTPQTLINDLKSGICDPKRLVLIVVDEAHRATGSYAYVEVVQFVKRFNESFRVLALTATPGATIESVQQVIDGLTISRVEIRTEDSIDIRNFVYSRKTETVLFDNSPEMEMILELFAKSLQSTVNMLNGFNAYWSKDPLTLTPYGCTQARQKWFASEAGRSANPAVKNMVMTNFTLLASLSHATELLKFHGLGPFYHKVLGFRDGLHAGGKKGGKQANEINNSKEFQTMMSRLQIWINTSDFIGHPKLEYVQRVVLNHFLDAGEGRSDADPSSTRIMIFAHYRQSAEEIARILKRREPMIRPHVFVGQSNVKDSEGMDQKQQLDIISKFQSGIYNTLVATSIGEEGLDIGQVDLIVCYDASSSPIRMLQRMGRTGRKRAGNIIVTLMRGKEENNFMKAKDNYEKMQHEIASGARFVFHEETARRIVPKEIQPTVDKCVIDIPVENTQAELPEPAKRGRPPKRPPKKFHMPDAVHTGFRKASRLYTDSDSEQTSDEAMGNHGLKELSCAPVPTLAEVTLTTEQQQSFEQNYLEISGDVHEIVQAPSLDRFPKLQSTLRPTKYVEHSWATQRMVKALQFKAFESLLELVDSADKHDIYAQAVRREQYFSQFSQRITEGALDGDLTLHSSIDSAQDVESLAMLEIDKQASQSPSNSGSDREILSSARSNVEDSEDDLPDLAAIVNVPQKPIHQGKGKRKRRGNRVLEDESDE